MHTTSSSIFEPSIAENREPPLASIVSPGLWATHAIRASDLQAKAFEPLRYVLPGLIPEGASLLVGRPKLGKSWLALDLCIAIADERTTLGALQPAAGDVLYLALEDGERRLQRRMATLLPNANGWPARLTLATRWKRANEGGLADIRDWCKWVEKPTAVVVDTLEKFRGLPGGRGFGQQPYYEAVVQLQKIAAERGVAVIVVHHQSRTSADDPFDTIAGATGLAGAADTILMMKRTERGAVLSVRGRDVEDIRNAADLQPRDLQMERLRTGGTADVGRTGGDRCAARAGGRPGAGARYRRGDRQQPRRRRYAAASDGG